MERKYKGGELVWVLASKRLGWWPAVVQKLEILKPDLKGDVTNATLAVVKFLNEDNYQFIEDPATICAYDSGQKKEYIAYGMKKYFEKKRVNETSSTFMKFPNDVRQAEKLNGGNPNIVDDEQFQPKKPTPAQSKYKDIFVDPKSKDVKTKSPVKTATTGSPRRPGRPPKQKPTTPPASSPSKVIHPRFQGQSDHEVRIRRQESTPPSSSSSSVTSPMSSPTSGTYMCDTCNFQTGRLNLMILHKKSHLGTLEPAVSASASATSKAGQKRLSSPVKKTVVPNKKSKKATAEETSGAEGGDLFDQVKRNLDGTKEEGVVKQTPKKPRQSTAKAVKASPQPSTPKTPRTSKSTTPKSASSKTSSVPAKSTEKAQLNPKKKWLKSSLQKDDNPEVKIKLMADWEEDEEEQQLRKEAALKKEAADAAAAAAEEVTKEKQIQPESDSDQDLPAKSGLLQQRSDDEDDGDYQMETESSAKSPEKALAAPAQIASTDVQSPPPKAEAFPASEAASTTSPSTPKANETLVESESTNNASDGEPLAGLSAEIDKLNAEMDQMAQSNRMVESSAPPAQSTSVNGERASHVNGIGPLPSTNSSVAISNGIDSKRDEEIKQDVASLLAETSVPVLPDLSGLNKAQNIPPPPPVALKHDQEESVIVQEQQQHVQQLEIGTGNGNILVEGEDGETYMVVWEQDSNMQELLVQGDDEGTGTRTLLIDPSSLQGSGTDFEKLFQMAVHAAEANSSTNSATIAAAAPIATTSTVAPSDPQSSEQSNATNSNLANEKERNSNVAIVKTCSPVQVKGKGSKSITEEFLTLYGTAADREIELNTVVWISVNAQLFLPCAVVDSTDPKFLTVACFDVQRPDNTRKYSRKKVIPHFHLPQLNSELLAFGRARNKAPERAKLNEGYDHAFQFDELRRIKSFPNLSVHQYLYCCSRSPFKLFSDRYLKDDPDDEIMRPLPKYELDDTANSNEESEEDNELHWKLEIVGRMMEEHLLTDACLQHLAAFVAQPSERLTLYHEKNFTKLSQSSAVGILEKSKKLYSKLADFLNANVHRVSELVDGQDHKRNFVLDLLLPEALIYGVQKMFQVGPIEAAKIVVYGIKKHNQLPHQEDGPQSQLNGAGQFK